MSTNLSNYDDGPHYAPDGHGWASTGRHNSRRHLVALDTTDHFGWATSALCRVGCPGTPSEATWGEHALDADQLCPKCIKIAAAAGPVALGCGCTISRIRVAGHTDGCDR